jgi:hypothetical protein
VEVWRDGVRGRFLGDKDGCTRSAYVRKGRGGVALSSGSAVVASHVAACYRPALFACPGCTRGMAIMQMVRNGDMSDV